MFTAATWRTTFDQPLPFQGQRAIIVMGDTYFEAQLRLYESKIGRGEADPQAMVFREGWREH